MVLINIFMTPVKKLKNGKYRMSSQRRLILEYLRTHKGHATAEEVFAALKNRWRSMGLGTVYRNLNFLHEHGYIEEIFAPGHIAMYSGRVDPHLHFRCDNCGTIYEFDMPNVFLGERNRLRDEGFAIRQELFEFSGICQKCSEKETRELRVAPILCQAHMKFSDGLPLDPVMCAPCAFQETCLYQVPKK